MFSKYSPVHFLALSALLVSLGCSSAQKGTTNLQKKVPALTKTEARLRSNQISNVDYRLKFDLMDRNLFSGTTTLSFDYSPNTSESEKLRVDLREADLLEVTINGETVDVPKATLQYDENRFYIPTGKLSDTKTNQIIIRYQRPYGNTGYGLHSFQDPVDKEYYLFTHLEPFHANEVFPCFDQPDLKASYEVEVIAPKQWTVISNTLEKSVHSNTKKKTWSFPKTQRFSTYLFALHAGPYQSWSKSIEDVPARLFSRKSISKFVDSANWFKVTAQGLKFYRTYFGLPYPFHKYDQILVPDFNAGAMENVGAVTFSESYAFQSPPTQDQLRRRANVILHEMAHMWFGDLVTMKWWNGLWLNESFATFMASYAVDNATNYKGGWQSFFSEMKEWAYWEDQLVTSHPIEVPVPSTNTANSIFDGITYGKGASTIKQLHFFLGDNFFKEGLQRYFQNFAYQNTELEDFIRMLEEASETDLSQWTQSWLKASGVNRLQVDFSCTKSKNGAREVSEIVLKQFESPLRPHRIKLGLYRLPKGKWKYSAKIKPYKTLETEYRKGITTMSLLPGKKGASCPDFIFPNFDDRDYVKISFSSAQLKFIKKRLNQIDSALTRQMIYHSLWEMVLDGELNANEYSDVVFSQGEHETNTLILAEILSNLSDPSPHRASVSRYLTGEKRTALQEKTESFIKNKLQHARGGSDLQNLLFGKYLRTATSKDSAIWLEKLLAGKSKLKYFDINQERRWQIIGTLSRLNVTNIEERIQTELKADPSDLAQRYAIHARTSVPTPENKKYWQKRILHNFEAQKEDRLPIARIRNAMRAYHHIDLEDSTEKLIPSYFDALKEFAFSENEEKREYASWYVRSMYPATCSETLLKSTSVFLKDHPNLPRVVQKGLQVSQQMEERCIRARKKAQGQQSKNKTGTNLGS